MFNEKKFIDDFIDENYRDNLEDRDINMISLTFHYSQHPITIKRKNVQVTH